MLFLCVKESLKKMRELDDKIIYALNTSIPTESFKGQISPGQTCERLYNQLQENYVQREKAITNCILVTADSVKGLKGKRDENRDDIQATQAFKNEQRKVGISFFSQNSFRCASSSTIFFFV